MMAYHGAQFSLLINVAIDPKARTVTLSYPGGTVTAVLGLIEYIFGTQTIGWQTLAGPALTPGGRRRRKYGTRQRSAAAGGRVMNLRLDEGHVWQVRYSGTDLDFISAVISKTVPGRVKQAWTPRGTIYGPQLGVLV
jgi:hypothetical protein